MMNSILKDFLLFEVPSIIEVSEKINSYSLLFVAAFLIFELMIQLFSHKQPLEEVFKRFLFVHFIIMFMPTFFTPIASAGFLIGDSILKEKSLESKTGFVSNWFKVKKAIKEKTGKEATVANTLINTFLFSVDDVVGRGAVLGIATIMLILKAIYTVIFYLTFLLISSRAALAVMGQFSGNLGGIVSGVIYLILVPIVVASILYFSNDVFEFQANSKGFIDSLEGLAGFIVIGLLLLGSFYVAYSLMQSTGLEGWGASMSSMLSAGFGYKILGAGMRPLETSVNSMMSAGLGLATGGAGVVAGGVAPFVKGVGNIVSSPLKQTLGGIKSGMGNFFSSKVNSSQPNTSYWGGGSSMMANFNPSDSVTNGTYQNAFNSVAGSPDQIRVRDAVNPVNHIKASVQATKDASMNMRAKLNHSMGIPQNVSNLSLGDRANYLGNKIFNGSNLSSEEQIKNGITANRISKRLDR